MFLVFNVNEAYMEQEVKLIEDKQKVDSVITSTFNYDEHLYEASRSPYLGYKKFCEQFVTDLALEQCQILSKLESLHFRDMDSYIKQYKKLFAEYKNVKGKPESEELKRAFISNLPEEYDLQMEIIPTTAPLTKYYNYFRKFHQKRVTLKIDKQKNSSHSNSNRKPRRNGKNNSKVRKTMALEQKCKKKKTNSEADNEEHYPRCYNCTRWRHKRGECKSVVIQ